MRPRTTGSDGNGESVVGVGNPNIPTGFVHIKTLQGSEPHKRHLVGGDAD